MRPKAHETKAFPADRRFVLAAMRAGRRHATVHGLTAVDVTAATEALQSCRPPLSITGYVVAAVARAVARHPEVAAYRDWWGRLVTHRHVDVATMVEVDGVSGRFPLAHVIRNADVRSVADISRELTAVKSDPQRSVSGRLLTPAWAKAGRLPGVASLMYAVLARSPRLRMWSGTVTVTSIGMFAGGDGFGIGVPTIMTLTVLVGGMSERPVVRDGDVVVRLMLDLTVSVDHRIVDGAPIARFGADLRTMIENPNTLLAPN